MNGRTLIHAEKTLAVPVRLGRTGAVALYLAFGAALARTLASTPDQSRWPAYLGLHGVILILFAVAAHRRGLPPWLLHLFFAVQAAAILAILALNPELDIVVTLFALLCCLAVLAFAGPGRWLWIGLSLAFTAGSLMFYRGALPGLALALMPMAAGVVVAAYLVVDDEVERARAGSQSLLAELQAAHLRLQAHADVAEELAAVEERNRLARELHDSVSQTVFSLALNTRSAQLLLDRDPAGTRARLEHLQNLAQTALEEMRGLITQLRPHRD